ncbi:hypothetical protein BSL78_17859 [Apostichopus japonicus]|uniref:Uncharacterized protein n=1 Tax=Stichopus japonicus TaxID=307972 RepID=A0A2G8KBA0_STIJA|nr:hypothetical protein BSL78_17859 [Apostichopus japonicus]
MVCRYNDDFFAKRHVKFAFCFPAGLLSGSSDARYKSCPRGSGRGVVEGVPSTRKHPMVCRYNDDSLPKKACQIRILFSRWAYFWVSDARYEELAPGKRRRGGRGCPLYSKTPHGRPLQRRFLCQKGMSNSHFVFLLGLLSGSSDARYKELPPGKRKRGGRVCPPLLENTPWYAVTTTISLPKGMSTSHFVFPLGLLSGSSDAGYEELPPGRRKRGGRGCPLYSKTPHGMPLQHICLPKWPVKFVFVFPRWAYFLGPLTPATKSCPGGSGRGVVEGVLLY